MPEHELSFLSSVEKRRILVIEDESCSREKLTLFLEDTYTLIPAQSGAMAMKILSEQHSALSLILMDLHLPDVDGMELLRQIHADSRFARIPVIIISANYTAEVDCLTLGAIDFISKPFPDQEIVLARIRRTIQLYENQDILRRAEHDRLTGLYNREFFFRYTELLDAYHKDKPLDAILMDITHFHLINERYGKSYGDTVLQRIGRSLLCFVEKQGGIASRRDADNFLIYCPHVEDYAAMMEKISCCVAGEDAGENRVRLRMGVYPNVDKSIDIERRFDRAKMAADAIKGSFTTSINVYDEKLHQKNLLAQRLVEDFPAAIREKQFVVYYQPKFNVHPEVPELCSAEALVRWKHPTLGMVSPGVFIPLFEENGLVQALDYYVWAEAAAQIRDWKDRLGVSLPISVNVSRIDLCDPNLTIKLQELVERNGLSYKDLVLEITESSYAQDADQIIAVITGLRELGFRIEMDDFGSGYSSLNMLSAIPLDALKLDMEFIRNAFKGRKDTRLLEIMIQLAEVFGVPTIAEGVETDEQVLTLRAMGCDIIQGYYFSKPLPAEGFEAFMLEHRPGEAVFKITPDWLSPERFTYNAMHDPQTGFYNYSAFNILLRDADQTHLAVLVVEIDSYEKLKVEKGSDFVNRAVCRVAEVLQHSFRSVDFIGRLRENQFAVIITRVTVQEKDLMEGKVKKLLAIEEQEPIKLNVGLAFSVENEPERNLLRDADLAMEWNKQARLHGKARN